MEQVNRNIFKIQQITISNTVLYNVVGKTCMLMSFANNVFPQE